MKNKRIFNKTVLTILLALSTSTFIFAKNHDNKNHERKPERIEKEFPKFENQKRDFDTSIISGKIKKVKLSNTYFYVLETNSKETYVLNVNNFFEKKDFDDNKNNKKEKNEPPIIKVPNHIKPIEVGKMPKIEDLNAPHKKYENNKKENDKRNKSYNKNENKKEEFKIHSYDDLKKFNEKKVNIKGFINKESHIITVISIETK